MFAHRLKIAMELRNKTLTDVAEGSKINKGTISKYLNGKMKPKQEQVAKIANYLNVSIYYLMGYADNISFEARSISPVKINEALGIKSSDEEIMKQGLLDDITAICSRQDLETLKTMYSVIKTLAKE